MKILKFGGTSVGSAKNIIKVIEIVKNQSQNSDIAVIVSAVGGITDKLLNSANKAVAKDSTYKEIFNQIKSIHLDIIDELINTKSNTKIKEGINTKLDELEKLLEGIYLINELSPKTTDKLLSYGEQMSSYIIAVAMKLNAIDVKLKNSQELLITDTNYTNASVNFKITNNNIKSYFETNSHSVTLLPGFISRSENGETTTLGRGGSDYTAAIIASAIEAEELQIWTDVSGMFTTNPKLVKQAKPISHISYQEAVELSHFGAKVL